ncbi:S1C family serine protease [Tuwongella immobilis]|uniref:PDZ domain-containing protein n=1 Tax=Tuwongella immobilis TaxID=692036 RepID=A0A6C2YHA5_9BACT|nr:trypsin-like peptidase domain-containing protein [Tuwongella immobilis]VIP00631.1 2-alkenal reductase : 2-alkenal reductase OS=Candidatus Entotheonella sp. TSY2 GN=ETSY2_00310 PE=4 SV=1: Trypsin_2: PDZ_2 [Tuwongella immobilis]VTR96680.1 2-alkenal reductase : 2-alkenal reductase OS=Candidatus Entotheonella sp. TSY2 GN=ETSY2_00310 PE=4 SV=1: Trypsin_2: PDZ_2 [Tuwongella immobilis]
MARDRSFADDDFPEPRPHPIAPWAAVLGPSLLVLAVLAGLFFFVRTSRERPSLIPDAQLRETTPRISFNDIEKARIALFKTIKPSVVNVDTLLVQRTFNFGVIEQQQGTGSGFVWNKQGHIVTNFHVIQDAIVKDRRLTVRVVMADRSKWNARFVAASPDVDLAVLQIDAPEDQLVPIKVGTSHDLEVGQDVFAVGNPFGQNLTLTTGVISSTDREIQSPTDRPITGAIQTDAALNPGNSGGPLLDWDGRLIGVNTAITTTTGGSVGIGYAIPVDTVNEVVTRLIREGRDPRPTLGIVALREQLTRDLGIAEGVMIQEVRPNSAAEEAGLQGIRKNPFTGAIIKGDIITAINNEAVTSLRDLQKVLEKFKVGQKVTITILREGQELTVTGTLKGL